MRPRRRGEVDISDSDAAAFGPSAGPQLRTYRLALVTDPTYSNYFGGPANVTPAKVTLMNRVNQIYEDETSIRMVLIGNNDLLNLNTPAQMTQGNGPCGEIPCYTPAQATSCGGATLNRNRIVIGQIIGANNFDVGHIGLGNPGGGVASLGVVGGNSKAQGCTGLSAPVGDFFAVDYVAHEIGHQFAGNHTFNGTQVNCSGGNRNGANSVEPGSGSSIMAYAGICRQDDLQPHSDPYWSQRSFEEIINLVTGTRPPINEVQTASLNDFSGGTTELQTVQLSGFGGTDSFQLMYAGNNSPTITRGTNYDTAGIKAAIEATPAWPAGGTVTVTGIGGGALTDAGFDVTFGGTLASTDAAPLTVVNGIGVTGTTTEIFNGGPTFDSFTLNYNGANSVPIVHGSNYTLAGLSEALQGASEVQTVSLTGYDADGDSYTLSYGGGTTVPIVRGQNNTAAGVQNAIQGGNEQQQAILTGFDGATQSFQVQIGGQNSAVLGFGGQAISNANVAAAVNAIPGFAGTVTSAGAGNTGFTLTFAGASANVDVPSISIVNCTPTCTSSVRELAKGGVAMAGWPSGGTVAVGTVTDTGYALTFSGAHQGTDVGPFSVTNGTGGTAGTVAETVKGTQGLLPVGATATVAAWGGAGALNDAGFQVTFGGTLGLVNVSALTLTNMTGLTGFIGETARGGPIDNQGFTITNTGNSAPVVTAPAGFTIPTRTPFALTGSATDANGDTLTYLWEQNDRGGAVGTALVNPNKVDGPIFRQFGTALDTTVYNPAQYNSPGENHPTTSPTRVFPDMPQVLADNTNAETGNCPGAPAPPSPPSGGTNVPQPLIDCYSEWLPTFMWVGFLADRTLHFRLTARDGNGGIGSQPVDTALVIAPAAGPFLVTSQATPTTAGGRSALPVTWDVAGTNTAPINTANVRITLSTDGGASFPTVLVASTPNDGAESVTLPNTPTTQGRIKVEAVGNVYFDVSDANLTIQGIADLTRSPVNAVEYSDSFAPDLTVTATDPDTPGSGLSAVATGLPPGMSLQVLSTSDGTTLPGTRTWRVAGTAVGPARAPQRDRQRHRRRRTRDLDCVHDPGDAGGREGDVHGRHARHHACVVRGSDAECERGRRRGRAGIRGQRAGRHPQSDGHLPGGLGDPLRAAPGAVVERGQHGGHGVLQGDAVAWDTQRPGRGRRPLHRHHHGEGRDSAARRLLRAGSARPALRRTADASQRDRAARRCPLRERAGSLPGARPRPNGEGERCRCRENDRERPSDRDAPRERPGERQDARLPRHEPRGAGKRHGRRQHGRRRTHGSAAPLAGMKAGPAARRAPRYPSSGPCSLPRRSF